MRCAQVEITLQPWHAFKPDGVVLFSDILTPLQVRLKCCMRRAAITPVQRAMVFVGGSEGCRAVCKAASWSAGNMPEVLQCAADADNNRIA
jgi:hypothetical protein